MKEVIAILRPTRWQQTKERLAELNISAFTQCRVLGRGKERGLHYLPKSGTSSNEGIRSIPKRMVWWAIEDHQLHDLIHTLFAIHQTDQIGDGKIFVLPIDKVVRIRTGEEGTSALGSWQVPLTLKAANEEITDDQIPITQ